MVIEYPTLESKAVKRQGEVWLVCDEPGCGKETKLELKSFERQEGRNTVTGVAAPVPKGWRSSNPDALAGASDFCPAHVDRIYVPELGADIPEPIRDEGDTQQ